MNAILKKSAILLSIFLLFSCSDDVQQNKTTEKTPKSFNLEKITKNYNNTPSNNIDAVYYEDHLDFGISKQNLVILVGNAGNYKTSFKIQLDSEAVENLKHLKAGKFKIAYLARDIILSNENSTYYFTVDDVPNYKEIALGSNLTIVSGIVHWDNNELRNSSSKSNAFKIVDEGASCTCEPIYGPKKLCHSGGAGSTSCSQGDCSVSCGGGHYACCNE